MHILRCSNRYRYTGTQTNTYANIKTPELTSTHRNITNTYMHIYTHRHTNIHTHRYIYKNTQTHIYTQAYTHISQHTVILTGTQRHIHTLTTDSNKASKGLLLRLEGMSREAWGHPLLSLVSPGSSWRWQQ